MEPHSEPNATPARSGGPWRRAAETCGETLLLGIGALLWAASVAATAALGGTVAFAIVGPGIMLGGFWWEVRSEEARAHRQGREPDAVASAAHSLVSYAIFPAVPVVMAADLASPADMAVLVGSIAILEGLLLLSPLGFRTVHVMARRGVPDDRLPPARGGAAFVLLAGGAVAAAAAGAVPWGAFALAVAAHGVATSIAAGAARWRLPRSSG